MANWQGRTALILAGAPQDELSYVRELYEQLDAPLVVCADRGLEYALRLGLRPDLFVGDRDSSVSALPDCECIRLTPEKDDTDTMHAVNILIDRGCKNLMLVCATGGRIDHMLSNLGLCESCAARGVRLRVADARNIVELGEDVPVQLRKLEKFPYFSLIPLDRVLDGVTIRGAKYPLTGQRVTRGDSLTISNECAADVVELSVARGRWLLIRSKD